MDKGRYSTESIDGMVKGVERDDEFKNEVTKLDLPGLQGMAITARDAYTNAINSETPWTVQNCAVNEASLERMGSLLTTSIAALEKACKKVREYREDIALSDKAAKAFNSCLGW